MDNQPTIDHLKTIVKSFCDEREWDQFHDPKELAIGIVTEASELLDIFRFKSKDQMQELFKDTDRRTAIEEEAADVLYFLLRFCQMNNVNLEEAFLKKMEKNAIKYPVEKAKGVNKKYTEY